MRTPEEILQKHVPNRFPKDNPYVAAMEEYASQSKPESVANLGEISDNKTTIKSVTTCPTCGSECEIGSGDSGSHYYIPNRIKPVDTKTVDAVEFAEWIAGCGYDKSFDKDGNTFWHDGHERIATTTKELLNLYIESKK